MSLCLSPCPCPPSLVPWMTPPRRKGAARHTADLYRVDRLRHIRCAEAHLLDGLTIRVLARRRRVSPTTIHRWVHAALGYSDPEAVELRAQLADRSR